jgi:intracellular multiplication protein IcmG
MADEKKGHDEYEYPSEDSYKGEEPHYPPEEKIEPLESEETIRRSFSRRFILVLAILVMIGIVYLIVSHKAKRNAELAAATPSVTNPAAANMAVAPAPTTTSNLQAQPQPPGAPSPLVAPVTTAPNLPAATAQNQAAEQSITSLQGQVQQLQTQMSDLSNSIATLTNQIQVIANEMRAIALGQQLKGRGMEVPIRCRAYYLKAIVPGRAWLQARNGATTTVTIGDRLPGYGIIQMINVQQGIVTTSSGGIIQYGPKDS